MITDIREQLIRDEGEVLHAYQDTENYWTIGIGRLIDKRRGGGISKAESAYLLDNDITRIKAQITKDLPFFSALSLARQGVLLNMAFQLGIPGLLAFKKTLRLIELGQYAQAAIEMLDSVWARQTPNRAKRLSEQLKTGQWQ